jgi:5-formyltetrahydrofolate cyclo-ligase
MLRLQALGARLALPVTPPKGSNAALVFRLWEPHHPLAPGHFQIHEPHEGSPAAEPDLVLVPLMAFDRTGHRLGYGAGHFDRTLERLRALKPITAIGLAYAVQEVDRIPSSAHDQKLDAVLTERAYLAPLSATRMS